MLWASLVLIGAGLICLLLYFREQSHNKEAHTETAEDLPPLQLESKETQTAPAAPVAALAPSLILEQGIYENLYVSYIYDGDGLDVLIDESPYDIRLAYIDAPEYNSKKPPKENQPYGYEAQHYVWQRVFRKWGRRVNLKVVAADHRYKRSVAEVYPPSNLGKGRSLNYELVKAGLAWYYAKYPPEREGLRLLYERAGAIAKEQKAGLWQQSTPLAPWDFRRQ